MGTLDSRPGTLIGHADQQRSEFMNFADERYNVSGLRLKILRKLALRVFRVGDRGSGSGHSAGFSWRVSVC
jgi:hypothetical protein